MTDKFYGFTDTITVQTEKQYAQMGDNNISNTLCMSAVELLQSKTIQENTILRNSLQKEAGELSFIVQGKSIAQTRKAQRNKKKVDHSIATAHLPVEYSTVSAVVTPVTPIGQKDNIR